MGYDMVRCLKVGILVMGDLVIASLVVRGLDVADSMRLRRHDILGLLVDRHSNVRRLVSDRKWLIVGNLQELLGLCKGLNGHGNISLSPVVLMVRVAWMHDVKPAGLGAKPGQSSCGN